MAWDLKGMYNYSGGETGEDKSSWGVPAQPMAGTPVGGQIRWTDYGQGLGGGYQVMNDGWEEGSWDYADPGSWETGPGASQNYRYRRWNPGTAGDSWSPGTEGSWQYANDLNPAMASNLFEGGVHNPTDMGQARLANLNDYMSNGMWDLTPGSEFSQRMFSQQSGLMPKMQGDPYSDPELMARFLTSNISSMGSNAVRQAADMDWAGQTNSNLFRGLDPEYARQVAPHLSGQLRAQQQSLDHQDFGDQISDLADQFITPQMLAGFLLGGPLAGALGGGLMGAAGSGAIMGGLGSSAMGGNFLEGALMGGLGGGASYGVFGGGGTPTESGAIAPDVSAGGGFESAGMGMGESGIGFGGETGVSSMASPTMAMEGGSSMFGPMAEGGNTAFDTYLSDGPAGSFDPAGSEIGGGMSGGNSRLADWLDSTARPQSSMMMAADTSTLSPTEAFVTGVSQPSSQVYWDQVQPYFPGVDLSGSSMSSGDDLDFGTQDPAAMETPDYGYEYGDLADYEMAGGDMAQGYDPSSGIQDGIDYNDIAAGMEGQMAANAPQSPGFLEQAASAYERMRDPLKLLGAVGQMGLSRQNRGRMEDMLRQQQAQAFDHREYDNLVRNYQDPEQRMNMLRNTPGFLESQRWLTDEEQRRLAAQGRFAQQGHGGAVSSNWSVPMASVVARHAQDWDRQIFGQLQALSGMGFDPAGPRAALQGAFIPSMNEQEDRAYRGLMEALGSNENLIPQSLRGLSSFLS